MNSFLKVLTTNPLSQIWFILRIQSFWTFFNMTHRIGSKNEHFFSTWLKENVSFFSLTQYFSLTQCMTQRINWSFLENRTQRIELFFFNLTLRIEPSFLNMTQRIEPFSQSDSKNCFFFSIWLEELNPLFWICLNELNPFVNWLRELNPVFFFFQYDSKTWPSSKIWFSRIEPFWKYESKDWTFEIVTQSIEPFFFSIWVNESNPLFQHESKKWIFLNMTHKTQRIETSFNKWLEELNFFWRKNMTHKTEPFFMWLTELNHSFQHESLKLNLFYF